MPVLSLKIENQLVTNFSFKSDYGSLLTDVIFINESDKPVLFALQLWPIKVAVKCFVVFWASVSYQNNRAYQPSSLSTIEPINHQAY